MNQLQPSLPTNLEKRAAFLKKLESGEYRELFGEQLNSIFTKAAKQLEDVGMTEEIGSLRFVLAKVLAEESDLNRMATNVSRIVAITVRAVQTHNLTLSNVDTDFVKKLQEIIDEVESDSARDDDASS